MGRHVDIAFVIKSIVEGKVCFFSIMAFIIAVGMAYIRWADYEYDVYYTVSPAQGGAISLGSNLGGLASLAGISLPQSQGESNLALYLEEIYSRSTAERLASDPHLMRRIFAREWNGKGWEAPQGVGTTIKNVAKSVIGVPKPFWMPPDSARVQEYIEKNVMVGANPQSNTYTISIVAEDPALGKDILAALHAGTDKLLRERALVRTDAFVKYLTGKLHEATITEHRQAIAEAIFEQEKVRMAAVAATHFAAEPLSPPIASGRPMHPKPYFVLLLSVGLGIVLAVAASVARNILREGRRRDMAAV